MSDKIKKIDLESENLVDDRLEQLKKLMPEAFSESGIDFDKLRLLLGDEVDEGDERYAFTWPGKADAIRQSQTTSRATLRPCVEKSRGRNGKDGSFDSDNIYIEGDNLEALKLLQRAYHGKVKMIYIDPPYNTGHDFVYKDKFGDTIENYKEQTGQAHQSNSETSGRYHSAWCSMMYPRLKLASELLTEDGIIFISIDDNEIENLLKLANEVFSDSCFVATLPRVTKKSGKDHSATVANNHDYVCVYAKNRDLLQLNGFEVGDGYPLIDEYYKERGPYKLNQTLDYDSLWYHPKMDFPIKVDGTVYYPGGSKSKHDARHAGQHAPKDWVWRWSMPKFEFGYQHGFVDIKQGRDRPRIYTKTYRNASIVKSTEGDYSIEYIDRSSKMSSLEFLDNSYSNDNAKKDLEKVHMGSDFDFPKPIALLLKLLELVQFDAGDVVLDFFSGSATTAAAIIEYISKQGEQIRSIQIQLPEALESSDSKTICDIGEERIRRVGDKIAEEVAESNNQLKLDEAPKQLPDIGFRVFKLDESGIAEPQNGQLLVNRKKDGRSDLDIIFEVMLKWGYELTYPIEKAEFAGYGCYSVAAGDLICCMEPGLTVDALEAIAAEQPRRVFIMDSVFGHEDSLKLDALAIFKHAEEQTQQKIELRTV
jgi:adenine-specific DNA-methyltransferase